MTDNQMEGQIRGLIKKYNGLPNRSGELHLSKNIVTKEYFLMAEFKGELKHIYSTPYMSELEGIILGLLLANDYDYFGKGTKNVLYRCVTK